jgi:hypothetical protein
MPVTVNPKSVIPPNAPSYASGQTRQPGLLENVRDCLGLRHYSLRTEDAYLWLGSQTPVLMTAHHMA